MNPHELLAWRKTYLVSQGQLADLLDVHTNTVSRWELGESRIPGMVPLALETIAGQRAQLIRSLAARKRRRALAKKRGVA